MIRFLVRLFAFIGLLAVVLVVGAGLWVRSALEEGEELPEAVVLRLDLDRPLPEHAGENPILAALSRREESLRDVVDALDRGARDPRVKGVVARIGGDRFGLAQAQELRAAVDRFQAGGRFAIAFADTIGEFGPGNVSYYLASGFDEVWLQPVGMVGLTGIVSDVPFLRGALERFGIQPQIGQRAEFKSFANTFTERDFTPAHREMTEDLVGNLTEQLLAGIAEGRRLGPAALRDLLDRGPFLDRLGYRDEAEAAARDRAGPGAGLVGARDYLDAAGRPNAEGPKVALVYGSGGIVRGEQEPSPLAAAGMAADDVAEALGRAAADPAVRAIDFRIDSGGGSAVASETIRRAVARARDAGKPLVVSMAGAAASGGYWIALGADRVVALPATLTGSIGVLAGKMVVEDLFAALGVNWGQVAGGRNAEMWSNFSGYDEGEMRRRDAFLDEIYRTFTERVAEARRLSPESVQEIARGRVWTGAQAQALGLVDVLGGHEEALAEARRLGGLAPGSPVTVEVFPRPEGPLQEVLDLAFGDARAGAALAEALAPLLRAAAVLSPPGPVTMPETGLARPWR